MSRYKDNLCVGCPQGCISCGRNRDYEIVECDICGKTITDEYDFHEHEGKDYCDKCYDKMLEEEEDE